VYEGFSLLSVVCVLCFLNRGKIVKCTSLLKYFGLTLNYFIIQYIVYVMDINTLWWTAICVAAATVLISMT
jgi:hypothetical protein